MMQINVLLPIIDVLHLLNYFQVEAIKIEVETFAKEVETEKIIAVQSADELVRWEEEVKACPSKYFFSFSKYFHDLSNNLGKSLF